jgi:hypothetical protein
MHRSTRATGVLTVLESIRRERRGARARRRIQVASTIAIALAGGAVRGAGAGNGDAPVLNEVLYDAPGADAGQEFIELAAGRAACPLAGCVLERGNGGRPDDWQSVWSAAPDDSIPPGGHFVVGGAAVLPLPAATVELGLQNGPDACRLLRDGVVIDLLGWGEQTHPGYAEGSPAPDVAAGTSLARIPDGQDTDDNARDWQPLRTPCPGQPNRAPPPLRLESPGHHSSGQGLYTLHLAWRLTRDGQLPAADAALSVLDLADDCLICGEAQLLAGPIEVAVGELEVGEAVEGEIGVTGPPAGTGTLSLLVEAGTRRDTLPVAVRVGPGALRVTELMVRPPAGSGEWIEVVNASAQAVDLRGYALSDARLELVALAGGRWDGTTRGAAADAAWMLGAGAVAVVAAAPPPVGAALVLDGWPALNDGGDRVRLVDAAGRTSEDVPYAGAWVVDGASLERLDLDLPAEERTTWVPAIDGTPGDWRSSFGAPSADFVTVAVPAVGGAPCVVTLAAPLRDGCLRLYRLDGRRVAAACGDALSGRTRWVWDRRDAGGDELPPGLYLLDLEGERWSDGRTVRARTVVGWGVAARR